MNHWPNPILFGAAYYFEYQPDAANGFDTEAARARLKTDLDLMAEAGFSVIRVGESVWSTWEPENGRFDLDWLQPVLDAAHERGIAVVLGTPTYAVPPWLVRLYPEIAGEHRTGERIGWGGRQEVDYTHPAFKFHAERVIRKILARYAAHPAVIGFQVDNEPGLQNFHNEGVFQQFVDRLRHEYGDVETLNREWGLVYWSHRLSTWADLWRPDGNMQPQYTLAWRRFQADLTTEFIGWQADLAREYASADQFVTTCISYSRPGIDDPSLTARLDVTAGNPYYRMQDGLALPAAGDGDAINWNTQGTWALYHSADRMYSSKQAPFMVTETNAQAIGEPWRNEPAYDGQWRQAAWALISRGASMVEYWQWHTLHFGTETYWGGVLPHSLRPGRVYRELARLGKELRKAGGALDGLVPGADVAVLYSKRSEWALAAQPQIAKDDGSPEHRSFEAIVGPFYRGTFDARLQARIVHTGQLGDPSEAVSAYPVLVAAGLYAEDDELLDWLDRYASAGGHLVVGPRTGYGDQEARARLDVKPARLAEAAGVWYEEFANLSGEVPVRAVEGSGLELGDDAAAAKWADGLYLDGAETLAEYVHPHYGRFPAVTTNAHGLGRVTYVGTMPNAAFGKALFDWIATGAEDPWRPTQPSVTVTSGVSGEGRTVRFVHNWSWDEVEFTLPAAVEDALEDEGFDEGAVLRLGAWDVKVLIER
jgi:beta-galactosidase